MAAAFFFPARARAKPKLHAPSTPVYCQTLPTPLRLPTYIVSRNTVSPTASEPRWRCSTAWAARRSRSARSVTGPPSAASASAAASRIARRFSPASTSTLSTVEGLTRQPPNRRLVNCQAIERGPSVGCSTA